FGPFRRRIAAGHGGASRDETCDGDPAEQNRPTHRSSPREQNHPDNSAESNGRPWAVRPPGSGRTGSASRAFGVDSERRCALANYVNKDNNFELAEPTSRTCPHCGVDARLLPVATPSFEELARARPSRTG